MTDNLITATLALDPHSLNYQVKFRPDEALALALQLGKYNNATPEGLARLIEEAGALIPRMDFGLLNGEPNVNNGRTHHTWRIGREYSWVLYLDVSKTYLPAGFDYDRLASNLQYLGQWAHADEYHNTENDDLTFTYRFWWD